MEKLQGPINPCLLGEDFDVGWLEEFVSNIGSNYNNNNNSTINSYKFEEDPYNGEETPNYCTTLPSLEDKMPFLQMLQSVESTNNPPQLITPTTPELSFPFMQEPNYFQLLLRLQHQKFHINLSSNELESCVTNKNNDMILDMHPSPVKAEADAGGGDRDCEMERRGCDRGRFRGSSRSKKTQFRYDSLEGGGGVNNVIANGCREKRKRKRSTRPIKNKEEVENQRMTHIAVERNRRRQMNDHLNALRSLMPPSYVQRGDQASIVGGAIDFVKELEQMLQSLQARKKMRLLQSEEQTSVDVSAASSSTTTSSSLNNNMFMTSPTSPFQFRNFSPNDQDGNNKEVIRRNNNNNNNNNSINEEFSAENKSALADIEVVVIQNHVNLKIQCQRRPGQLLKAIMAFEELRLTILHLNITSLHSLVHYSFNLKIEDDCKLGSADEVARAVHQIFSLINL